MIQEGIQIGDIIRRGYLYKVVCEFGKIKAIPLYTDVIRLADGTAERYLEEIDLVYDFKYNEVSWEKVEQKKTTTTNNTFYDNTSSYTKRAIFVPTPIYAKIRYR